MKKKRISYNYFRSTLPIWLLLLVCLYCVLACEFEAIKCSFFSVNLEQEFVNKINNILKALSSSYIAGVVFFFLSDTVPFFRRKKIANRNVKKSLQLMIDAIDDYSLLTNGKNWNLKTNSESIFEDVFGVKYAEVKNSEKMPIYELSDDILTNFNRLSNVLITNVDFVITQELYIGSQLLNDMEELKLNDSFKLLKSLSSYKHITAEKFIQLYDMIIIIKQKINNYL